MNHPLYRYFQIPYSANSVSPSYIDRPFISVYAVNNPNPVDDPNSPLSFDSNKEAKRA